MQYVAIIRDRIGRYSFVPFTLDTVRDFTYEIVWVGVWKW